MRTKSNDMTTTSTTPAMIDYLRTTTLARLVDYDPGRDTGPDLDGGVVELHPVPGLDGWDVELHPDGLTLCSPGTCARGLGYRDESEELIWDLLPECIQEELVRDAADAALTLHHGAHTAYTLHLGQCYTTDERSAEIYADGGEVAGYDRDSDTAYGDDGDGQGADVLVYQDEDARGRAHDTYRLMTPAALEAVRSH